MSVEQNDHEDASSIPLTTGVAATIVAELGRAGVDLAAMADGQVYRLVGGADALANVAGSADRFRGFQLAGDGTITGHGMFAKPGLSAMSPTLVLTAASAALSCYWQKQIHDQLQQVNRKLNRLIDEVHRAKDATLSTAEDEIRMLSSLPVGSSVTMMPPAIADANTVLHNEASILLEQRTSIQAWSRGASLTDAIRFANRTLPDTVRFHRALAIDNQWTRLQLMSEASLRATSFRDRVLERASSRRQMVQDVAEVLRPMAQAKLIDDRTGAGEHLMPWMHGDRLKARRQDARRALRQLGGMNDVLDHDWRAIPRAAWWDNPYAIDVHQDAVGNPTATVTVLTH